MSEEITKELVANAIKELCENLTKHCLFHVSEQPLPVEGKNIEVFLILRGTTDTSEAIRGEVLFGKDFIKAMTRHCCQVDINLPVSRS
jgi:hypothetical protein